MKLLLTLIILVLLLPAQPNFPIIRTSTDGTIVVRKFSDGSIDCYVVSDESFGSSISCAKR